MTESILEYVIAQLGRNKQIWAEASAATGVPVPTIAKIAYRHTKSPGVLKIEALARYFRSKAQ